MSATPAGARDQAVIPAAPDPQDVPIALLADLNSGQVLHAREADRRFVPASVTKVMTAFLAFELIGEGRLSPDRVLTMDHEIFREWARKGSSMFLGDGARVTVDELLHGITTVSANDACIVLAKGAAGSTDKWVAMMNAKARELGMTDSHFGTPNGWMDDGRTFVSARDLMKLARAMITRHPELYRRYVGHRTFAYGGIQQANHDPMLGRVAGADGIKTGYTRQAGYNYLGTAQRDGRRLVMVLAGTARPNIRARAARAYIEWGFTHFANRRLFPANAVVGTAQVQDGSALSVPLVAPQAVIVSYARGTKPPISLRIHYSGPLKAPIRKGAEVAKLEVTIKGQQPIHVPLAAGEAVAQANWWQRLRNGLAGIVP
ncbi:MAG: D-alanyl-D-alanine carboxypeptidase [Novosphingobium sp.]|nr:D-alanyl-D-alanine carboxypeptidase [Novosphingobium sp.]